MKCLYCLNCPKFGQLIIRKIIRIRIIATRCVSDFGGKNVQNSISDGAPPQTLFGELTALLRWWSLQRFPDPMAFKGRTSKGREGKGREGKGREGKRKRKWASKKGVWAPQSSPQIDAAVANSVSTTRRTGVNQKQGSQQYNWLASAEPATKSNATSYQLGTTVITWHVIAKWADRPIQTEYLQTHWTASTRAAVER